MRTLEGKIVAKDVRIGIVAARFNDFITTKLLGGAVDGKYDAVICLGAVIRGATTHYDYVCAEVSKGIAQISLQTGIPVMFGVLTTDNIEQAIERAGSKAGNKGFDCAVGAIEMINLIREIQE